MIQSEQDTERKILLSIGRFCEQKNFDNIPDDIFIALYIDSIVCDGSNEEKVKVLDKLYDYSTGANETVDSKSYQIMNGFKNGIYV